MTGDILGAAEPWPTSLEVDLDAIAANWRALKSGPIAAVVKADAYGLGAPRVAARLHAEGCRHFFVAHPAEALAIRDCVPGAMLAVLNGLWPGVAPLLAAQDITPVLGSLAEIDAWTAQAHALGRPLPALLHVDTGMNRLGLDAQALAVLAGDPERLRGIDLRYVMTHLVSAECPDDPVNEQQRLRFAEACACLPAAPRSFANSSGLFLGPGFASDLARPGAALYGVNPTPGGRTRCGPWCACAPACCRSAPCRRAAPWAITASGPPSARAESPPFRWAMPTGFRAR
ncbi:MAG: alanine racemase [Acetobacteraceae bacterium]